MKNYKVRCGMLALFTVALADSASASLVAGFYQFDGTKAEPGTPPQMSNITADIWQPGIAAWLVSPLQASSGSNGSFDGTYGDALSTTVPVAGTMGSPQLASANFAPGDGAAQMRYNAQFDSKLGFYFRNDTQSAIPLGMFCFDIADIASGTAVHNFFSVDMLMGTLDPTNAYTKVATDPDYLSSVFTTIDSQTALYLGQVVVSTETNDYSDYCKSLGEPMLEPGKAVLFEFSAVRAPGSSAVDTVWVDNVALTAIPEPGSVLGLGTVLASGLLLRNRRRKS